MRRYNQFIKISLGLFLGLLSNANAQSVQEYLGEFPYMCSEASDREALPGHILRLGNLGMTRYGLSFFFPDQRDSQNLQMVSVLENAGIIGQPDQQPGLSMRSTPMGSFVVAQVFVGDPDNEPIVTCISPSIPLSSFDSGYYGTSFSWLDRPTLGYWLKYRKFNRWNWKRHWGRDLFDLRKRFRDSDRWRSRKYRDRNDFDRGRRFRDRNDDDRGRRFRDRDDDNRGRIRDRDDNDGRRFRRDDNRGRYIPRDNTQDRGRGTIIKRGKNIGDMRKRGGQRDIGEITTESPSRKDRKPGMGRLQQRERQQD